MHTRSYDGYGAVSGRWPDGRTAVRWLRPATLGIPTARLGAPRTRARQRGRVGGRSAARRRRTLGGVRIGRPTRRPPVRAELRKTPRVATHTGDEPALEVGALRRAQVGEATRLLARAFDHDPVIGHYM